jgi:hypothetical protein
MKKIFFPVFLFSVLINGCKKNDDTQPVPAPAEEKVVASFDITNLVSPDMIREGNICDFTNTSKGATSYTWDFGNNTSSSEVLPSNQSFVPCGGTYTITLTAKNKSGKIATCSHSYTILCRGKMAHRSGVIMAPTHYSTLELSKLVPEKNQEVK